MIKGYLVASLEWRVSSCFLELLLRYAQSNDVFESNLLNVIANAVKLSLELRIKCKSSSRYNFLLFFPS